jgi:hypothetical protein
MKRRGASRQFSDLVDRLVTPAELRAALERPMPRQEQEEVLELVRWFSRRYPTPLERLAYVRQAYRRWSRNPPM